MDLEKYFDEIYQDYDKYLIIPLALVAFALIVLGANYITTGQTMQKGLDFTGGTSATIDIEGEFDTREIEDAFSDAGRTGVNVVKQTTDGETLASVQIPPPDISQEETEQILTDAGYTADVRAFRAISAAVSGQFFQQAQLAFVLAFTIMSLVIFTAFKDVVPSLAVIFAAAGDVLFAAAGMTLVGIPLTLGSLAALLMLIGYSVDTDIVLSTRVLKRQQGKLKERIWSSIKTGVTMSSGGIAAFIILYISSYIIVGPSELTNIAGVMIIGLIADIPLTWFGNAVILKKYVNGEFEGVMPWN